METVKTTELYDAYYYATGCGSQPYARSEGWLNNFRAIADRIIAGIAPATVLDAGCALGMLVEALREREVQAFGVDISEFAIRNVSPVIAPHCWVGSLIDPLPRSYDLIVTIEVLEHISASEGERVIANLCAHTDDILFSSTPFDYKEATHYNVQPPEYWVERFARQGFFRDVDFDASFITSWAARFRRSREPVGRVVAAYERRWWQLQQENQARRELNVEQRNELAAKEHELLRLRGQVEAGERQIQVLSAQLDTQRQDWEARWTELQSSLGWVVLRRLQSLRAWLAPHGSVRDQMLDDIFRAFSTRLPGPFLDAFRRGFFNLAQRMKILAWNHPPKGRLSERLQVIEVGAIQPRPPLQLHQVATDIIVCVHNARVEVQQCLESLVRHTTAPYNLILVDDGSDAPTHDYLAEFAAVRGVTLLHNKEASGYTRAANLGLHHSTAGYVVLLNSDTIVTPEWLDRMIACAESSPRIGMVGPLSNTASWQSIPDIECCGDWASNPLPTGITVDEMGGLVTGYSARLYPQMPLLNGFCLMLRREMVDEIGYLDEENFGAGFGEEDDYALRAHQAGWRLTLADDVYIYHAQSRSFTHERRKSLSERAGVVLAQKHGQELVQQAVTFCRNDRILEGIRARSRTIPERQEWIRKGQASFAGHRVLFALPVAEPGGGGNIIFDEAEAMRAMGVDVTIFNLAGNRPIFERGYPDLALPVVFGEPHDLVELAGQYDAVVATVNFTAGWLVQITPQNGRPVRGYYVQGFEPYIYATGSEDYRKALASYSLFPDMVRFTKTAWTRQEVASQVGVDCHLIGISVNIDLFRPRPRAGSEGNRDPVRIVAMVRTSTPYREPKLTMQVLRRAAQRYGSGVEIVTFGTEYDDPSLGEVARDFAWKTAGILPPEKVAGLLNEADIFVDYSSHQAMGLTALEAMACGAAVIVPRRGGATTFVRDGENGLVVDTTSPEVCWQALQRLIDERDLRARLQANALIDVCQFYPERPAYNILHTLFASAKNGGYQ